MKVRSQWKLTRLHGSSPFVNGSKLFVYGIKLFVNVRRFFLYGRRLFISASKLIVKENLLAVVSKVFYISNGINEEKSKVSVLLGIAKNAENRKIFLFIFTSFQTLEIGL